MWQAWILPDNPDPYPTGYDTSVTREIIKALKSYGNHVQILTKGDGSRDFDLLDENDWYGVTISCDKPLSNAAEPYAIDPVDRRFHLLKAKHRGISTWISYEPVLDPELVLYCIKHLAKDIDRVKIGKLNYHPSDIDWAQFGREAEALCKSLGLDYYIKDSLVKDFLIQFIKCSYFGHKVRPRTCFQILGLTLCYLIMRFALRSAFLPRQEKGRHIRQSFQALEYHPLPFF